ncbi:PREDICTED: wall-associated receptor kinase 2-like [Priapulus caudatus]|uniref:Wall-associated receptor kinase 2-like n=1 Tax=Priapulus caudatus TaxID=37621 RepID=A0ABM1F2K9_PRICU|nr:PREDICTED: wall-associated receptor kinase 2-like [Priapulus caudatus]
MGPEVKRGSNVKQAVESNSGSRGQRRDDIPRIWSDVTLELQAVDPCVDSMDCPANTDCEEDSPGYALCMCTDGYTSFSDVLVLDTYEVCQDVNECESGSVTCAAEHTVCINTPGSLTCACADGWEGDPTMGCFKKIDYWKKVTIGVSVGLATLCLIAIIVIVVLVVRYHTRSNIIVTEYE